MNKDRFVLYFTRLFGPPDFLFDPAVADPTNIATHSVNEFDWLDPSVGQKSAVVVGEFGNGVVHFLIKVLMFGLMLFFMSVLVKNVLFVVDEVVVVDSVEMDAE